MSSQSKFPLLEGPCVLSPMAGVTDVAFRSLARGYGAALTYTEFVSSAGLVRGNAHSLRMVETDPIEKPAAVQLFGSNAREVVEAAQMMEDLFDVIDINCGCPAWKVIKNGAGSELLKKPEGVARLVSRLAGAVSRPVTVKIRSGIDEHHVNAVEVAKVVEDAGAAAITVHGRTQKQGYRGASDWGLIKEVKKQVNIPVIGNGDVFTPEVFKKRLEESGVDGIMIARGAMGNPYVFTQVNDYLKRGVYGVKSSVDQFFEYVKRAEQYNLPYSMIKTHAVSCTKGVVGGSKVREQLSRCVTVEAMKSIVGSLAGQISV